MKKILWLGILLYLFFFMPHSALAAGTYSFTDNGATGTITISSTTSADFHISFPVVKNTVYDPRVCITTSTSTPCNGTSSPQIVYDTGAFANIKNSIPSVRTKAVTWDYTQINLDPTKVYYLIVYGSNGYKNNTPHEFFTGIENLADKPTINTIQDSNDIVVSAKIDTAKYPYYQELSASLVYSMDSNLINPIAGGALPGNQGPDANSAAGVNTVSTPGTFFWRLTNLTPSTLYYFQVTITSKAGAKISSDINSFNSSNGTFIPSGGAGGINSNLNPHIYTLLAPLPGFSSLPDPLECAREKAAGKAPAICDVNDLLNYFMKLLIGLSGVSLVFRIMYEGFVIMTSDLPFKVASSKSALFTAIWGLLLALSAYLILNTINPQLVAENVGINQLSIAVAGGDTNAPTTFVSTGQMPVNVYCPGNGRSAMISKIAQSYSGHVTYSQTNKSAAAGPDGNAVLDCSSFANTVLKCAGYTPGTDFINEGSASIFTSTEAVNMKTGFTVSGSNVLINNKQLNPGDLVGWTPSQGGGNGHVIIYIGNATFADSHSSSTPGGAIGIYPATTIQSLYGGSRANDTIQEVKRTPPL